MLFSSILSSYAQKNISGAQAGKENFGLMFCFSKKDCSKDKKIPTSACLTFLEIVKEWMEG